MADSDFATALPPTSESTPVEPPEDGPLWPWVLGAAIVSAIVVGGLLWLFLGSSTTTDVSDLPHTDGMVMKVDSTSLTLQQDGGKLTTFAVTESDASKLDIPHLQSHAALGLKTRVFYEKDGDKKYVRSAEDAPINESAEDRAQRSPQPMPKSVFEALIVGTTLARDIESVVGMEREEGFDTVDGKDLWCRTWDAAEGSGTFVACFASDGEKEKLVSKEARP